MFNSKMTLCSFVQRWLMINNSEEFQVFLKFGATIHQSFLTDDTSFLKMSIMVHSKFTLKSSSLFATFWPLWALMIRNNTIVKIMQESLKTHLQCKPYWVYLFKWNWKLLNKLSIYSCVCKRAIRFCSKGFSF